MMGVPPSGGSGGPPPDSPSNQGPSGSSNSGKTFKLPKEPKKQQDNKKTSKDDEKGKSKKGKKGDKKKDAPVANPAALMGKLGDKTALGTGQEVKGAEGVQGAKPVAKISALIQKLVEKLATGTVGNKQVTTLDLNKNPDIPKAFVGANLTVTQSADGISVQFSNFADAKSQADAALLLQDNKEELAHLVDRLSAKNINLTNLQVGNVNIALPRPHEAPPQAPVAPPQETYPQQDQDQGQQQQQGDQGQSEAEEE